MYTFRHIRLVAIFASKLPDKLLSNTFRHIIFIKGTYNIHTAMEVKGICFKTFYYILLLSKINQNIFTWKNSVTQFELCHELTLFKLCDRIFIILRKMYWFLRKHDRIWILWHNLEYCHTIWIVSSTINIAQRPKKKRLSPAKASTHSLNFSDLLAMSGCTSMYMSLINMYVVHDQWFITAPHHVLPLSG